MIIIIITVLILIIIIIRIEKDNEGNQAAVLAFYPEFQYEEIVDNEFVSFFINNLLIIY